MTSAEVLRPPTMQATAPDAPISLLPLEVSAGNGGSCGSDPGRGAERWKWVPDYEGLYEVSDQGRVRSVPRRTPAGMRGGRVLRATPTRTGYQSVALWEDGNEWRTYVHRLILLAFVGECPAGHEARHLNGRASDNRLVNLRWATDAVNGQDRVRHGTSTPGSKNPMAKLTEGDVCAIRERYAAGEKQADLAREHGITADAIGMIVRRERWRHVG